MPDWLAWLLLIAEAADRGNKALAPLGDCEKQKPSGNDACAMPSRQRVA